MKKFNFAIALCACLFVTSSILAQTTTTQTVVIGFEEAAPLTGYSVNSTRPGINEYWAFGFPPDDVCSNIDEDVNTWDDEPIYTVTYLSHDTTFQIRYGMYYNANDDYYGSFWSGVGLSTKSSKTGTSWYDKGDGYYYGDDLLSVSGSGNNNSNTYGVFGSITATPDTPSIIIPDGATLKSIAIANTEYAVDSMTNGDDFSNGLKNNGNYFFLTIEGKKANGATTGTVVVKLGEFVDDVLILNEGVSWQTILFDSSFEETKTLWFSFTGSDHNSEGLGTPCYFAFDDLTYEIEVEDDDEEEEIEEEK
jgi:hypothetical protein